MTPKRLALYKRYLMIQFIRGMNMSTINEENWLPMDLVAGNFVTQGLRLGPEVTGVIVGIGDFERAWFGQAYTPGQKAGRPKCFMKKGIISGEEPQSEDCRSCPHNSQGDKSCRACRWISFLSLDGVFYRMKIPPASLVSLTEYCKQATALGHNVGSLVTRLSQDKSVGFKKIAFEPTGKVSKEDEEHIYSTAIELGIPDVARPVEKQKVTFSFSELSQEEKRTAVEATREEPIPEVKPPVKPQAKASDDSLAKLRAKLSAL
jgi:hypothetical protein